MNTTIYHYAQLNLHHTAIPRISLQAAEASAPSHALSPEVVITTEKAFALNSERNTPLTHPF